MKTKLGIIATHPIQYQVPWFRGLAASGEVDLKVYFGLLPDAQSQGIGFGRAFQWDVPLLDGYPWQLLESSSKQPSLKGFFANRTQHLAQRIKDDGIEVMVITGWHAYPMMQALGACVRLGIPTVVRGESNAMRPRGLKAKLLHRMLLPWYQAYLAIGEGNAAFYRGNGIAAEKIFFARYFIDNDRFGTQAKALSQDRAGLRAQWGIRDDQTCFVYAGKLEPKKRIFDALEAVRLCAKAGQSVHLLVVGSGELEAQARAVVAQESLPVTFAGFMNQSEISKAYVAADAMVLPSDYGETWGLVINEAMISGLPVVISDRVGCGPDLVYGKDTGLVYPFGDAAALADRMTHLACDASSRVRMGENARRVVSAYCAQAAVEGTLDAVRFVRKKQR